MGDAIWKNWIANSISHSHAAPSRFHLCLPPVDLAKNGGVLQHNRSVCLDQVASLVTSNQSRVRVDTQPVKSLKVTNNQNTLKLDYEQGKARQEKIGDRGGNGEQVRRRDWRRLAPQTTKPYAVIDDVTKSFSWLLRVWPSWRPRKNRKLVADRDSHTHTWFAKT